MVQVYKSLEYSSGVHTTFKNYNFLQSLSKTKPSLVTIDKIRTYKTNQKISKS